MLAWNAGKFIYSVGVAILVGILLVGLVGPILTDMKVPIADTVGGFCKAYGFALGIVTGILFYFRG